MKKIVIFCMTALFLAITCSAVGEEYPRLIDNAELLTADEAAELCEYLDTVSEAHGIDVAVHTVDSLGGMSAMEYADTVYETLGYGFGDDHSGTLLLIAMGEREWHITTEGDAIYALDDYTLMRMEDEFIPHLLHNEYYESFIVFAQLCDVYFTDYISGGDVSDGYYSPDHMYDDYYYSPGYGYEREVQVSRGGLLTISLIAGFVIALITVSAMKSQLKSVRGVSGASSYEVDGSMRVTVARDIFLYRNTSKRRIDTDSGGHRAGGSSMRRSGGSSVHRSSSGRSHGGRGGRF